MPTHPTQTQDRRAAFEAAMRDIERAAQVQRDLVLAAMAQAGTR